MREEFREMAKITLFPPHPGAEDNCCTAVSYTVARMLGDLTD